MQYEKFHEIPLSTWCLQKISHVHWTLKKNNYWSCPIIRTLIFLPQIIGLLTLFNVEMQPKTKKAYDNNKINIK